MLHPCEKGLVFLCLILMVITISLVGCKQTTSPKENLSYVNETYGFSLTFPEKWHDKYTITESNDVVYIQNKNIADLNKEFAYGIIFRIEIYPKSEWDEDGMLQAGDPYGLKKIGENDRYLFGSAYATDVQVPFDNEKLAREYQDMVTDGEEILKTFTVTEKG